MNFEIINEKTIEIGKDCAPLDAMDIIEAVKETNNYIATLKKLFDEVEFDMFEALGQRNLSGLIGEIFSVLLAKKSNYLINNAHPDGRPDIIFVRDEEEKYHYEKCFITENELRYPSKALFTPFKYGGIEVKCTIGDPITKYRDKIAGIYPGKKNFELYMPRFHFLSNLNWWAHHTYSANLLGLYYDYYDCAGNLPQIIAVFNSELNQSDWNKVSIGTDSGKKTSNTSLNVLGKAKMKNNCICVLDDQRYISQLRKIGVSL